MSVKLISRIWYIHKINRQQKELKKLSKLQVPGAAESGPLSAPLISPSNTSATPVHAVGTPPVPSSTVNTIINAAQHPRMPQTPLSTGVGTPRPAPILQQRATSRPPTHTKASVPTNQSVDARPTVRPGSGLEMSTEGIRHSQKREREEDTGTPVHGFTHRKPESPLSGLKSVNGPNAFDGRPKPFKKSKMVMLRTMPMWTESLTLSCFRSILYWVLRIMDLIARLDSLTLISNLHPKGCNNVRPLLF